MRESVKIMKRFCPSVVHLWFSPDQPPDRNSFRKVSRYRSPICIMILLIYVTYTSCLEGPRWGSPKPIHLKPGHLEMAFFTARCRLDGTFPVLTVPCLSGRCFPCGTFLERAVRIDVSSANFRAKSHFQMSPFKMFPFRAS